MFDQAEMLLAINVPAHALQNWVNRGVIKLSMTNPGSGKRRKYSVSEACILALTQSLSELGLPVAEAAKVANECGALLLKTIATRETQAKPYIIIRRRRAIVHVFRAPGGYERQDSDFLFEFVGEDAKIADLTEYPTQGVGPYLVVPWESIMAATITKLGEILKARSTGGIEID